MNPPDIRSEIWRRFLSTLRHTKSGGEAAAIYLFKVNNRNPRARYEICSKLTIKTPCSSVSIVNFEQVNAGWVDAEIYLIFIEKINIILQIGSYGGNLRFTISYLSRPIERPVYSADVILKVSLNFTSTINIRANINTILSCFLWFFQRFYEDLLLL